jgi:S-adenosylmethionine:tRNA-ribosyltransferase-isomerase (queuine synthetase)
MAMTQTRARGEARLLRIDPCRRRFADGRIVELPGSLRPGDLLVLNDAATVPASLGASAHGSRIEVRLAGEEAPGEHRAVLFGEGDWRTPTERRPPPPVLAPGERLVFGDDLAAEIVARSPISPRLVRLRFEPAGRRSSPASSPTAGRCNTAMSRRRSRCGTCRPRTAAGPGPSSRRRPACRSRRRR